MVATFAASQMAFTPPTNSTDPTDPNLLERLASKYDSDKRWGLHKYTVAYASIFDSHRHSFVSVTEAGLLTGASAHIWLDYFPNAHINALDTNLKLFRVHPDHQHIRSTRLHLRKCCQSRADVLATGLKNASQDLVIDDAGLHDLELQLFLFELLWPLVKPNGWYVVEDVDPARGGDSYTQNHKALSPLMQQVLETHHAFLMDPTPGIPPAAWARYQRGPGSKRPKHLPWTANDTRGAPFVTSRVIHNSRLLVIHKLRRPRVSYDYLDQPMDQSIRPTNKPAK